MLHLIPAPLHRLAYRVAHALLMRWRRIARPVTRGVCVIALGPDGSLLLLRQSYGTTKWVLPGGGIGKREEPAEAARREFEEEAGCGIRDLAFAQISQEGLQGSPDTVHIFTGRTAGTPRPDGREIVEARFFSLEALPHDTQPRVIERLRLAGF